MDNLSNLISFSPDPGKFKFSNPLEIPDKVGSELIYCDPLTRNSSVIYSLDIFEYTDIYFANLKTFSLVLRPQLVLENLLPRPFSFFIYNNENLKAPLQKGKIEKGYLIYLNLFIIIFFFLFLFFIYIYFLFVI